MDQSDKRICGALNRQGKPCQKPPMRGKNRCLSHGGKTPKGRHNGPMTHGLYSQYMTPAEQERWDSIQVGVLDDELRMLRIYLARCVALDATLGKVTDGLELSEIRQASSSEDGLSASVRTLCQCGESPHGRKSQLRSRR